MMVFGMFNGEEYFLNGATVRVVFGFMFGCLDIGGKTKGATY